MSLYVAGASNNRGVAALAFPGGGGDFSLSIFQGSGVLSPPHIPSGDLIASDRFVFGSGELPGELEEFDVGQAGYRAMLDACRASPALD